MFYWQDVSNIKAHCDYINDVILEYKLKNGNDFTSVYVDLYDTNYIINTTEAGEYNIKLVVVNNEGLSSASNISTVTVIDVSVTDKGKSDSNSLWKVNII